MIKAVMVLCLLSALLTMCKKQTDEDIDFSLLFGKSYILKIDKISNSPNVQFPPNSLEESDYTATNEDLQYEITFSEDGQSITIEPGTIQGIRKKDVKNTLYYELGEGLFAGGRLIIWTHHDVFEAEYTVYGSGVPIVSSMRGILE